MIIKLNKGDHIYIQRYSPIVYTHHGIVVDDNIHSIKVAHPTMKGNTFKFAITNLMGFIGSLECCVNTNIFNIGYDYDVIRIRNLVKQNPYSLLHIKTYNTVLPKNTIVKNAINFINQNHRYCLLTNNCEMFADYCCTGIVSSTNKQLIYKINELIYGNKIINNIGNCIVEYISTLLKNE